MKVTAQLLIDAVGCTPDRAYLFATHLDDACDSYAINTPERLAAFLAQVGHESGSLRYVREIATGEAYENRRDLGNIQPGDGVRYRGRGLMQITGRDNYAATTARLVAKFNGVTPDFVDQPEQLESPRWAAISAADWWNSRGLNALADVGDFDRITKIINGGTNGQHDRRQRWERAKRVLAAYTSAERVENSAETVQTTSQIGRETPEMQGYQALEDAAAGDPAEYPQPEQPMPIPALVAALLPSLIESIPKLGALFGSGSDVQQRNVKAAEMALQVAQTAIGATNAQETVERIKSDPEARQKATQAIEQAWWQLTEVGGGISGARKADAEMAGGNPLKSPVLWVTVMLVPLVYVALYAVLFREGFSNDIKAMVLGAIFGGLLTGGIQAYFYGTSASSQRKTDIMGNGK